MNFFSIYKSFDFCYGHRVWNQNLNPEYSLTNECACKHLHGHQGQINVHVESLKGQTSIPEKGMIVDFKELQCIKKIIDDYIDHKFLIHSQDPCYSLIMNSFQYFGTQIPPLKNLHDDIWASNVSVVDIDKMVVSSSHVKEYYKSFVVVSFVPTSENICDWLSHCIRMTPLFQDPDMGIRLKRIEFKETPKTSCVVDIKY